MSKHKNILTGLFAFHGMLVFFALAMVLKEYSFLSLDAGGKASVFLGLAISIWFFSAAQSLYSNLSYSKKLCMPLAIINLISFPIGTIMGAYYIWFAFNDFGKNT